MCPTPQTCGEMQSGWPMPFADTGLPAPNNVTNSAGVYDFTGLPLDHDAHRPVRGHRRQLRPPQRQLGHRRPRPRRARTASTTARSATAAAPATPPPRARPSTRSTSSPSRPAAGCPPTSGCGRGWWRTSTSRRPATRSGTASTINFFRSGGGCGNTGEIAADLRPRVGPRPRRQRRQRRDLQLLRGLRRHRGHLPPADLLRGPRLLRRRPHPAPAA